MLVNFVSIDSITQNKRVISPSAPFSLDRVAVIILGGGEGKRLAPLTQSRCKPAISFGGRYTLIDVPISHSLTSGLFKIYVVGQYLAYTLQKHLAQTYLHYGIAQNHINLLVPEERAGEQIWYKGTADAVRQNLVHFEEIDADYFLILSGDQLYNINFQEMIQFALQTEADMVIAAQPVIEKDAGRMGLLKLQQGTTKLVDFTEKPQDSALLHQFYTDDATLKKMGFTSKDRHYLGSMGIYLFRREAMFSLLSEDAREDFGKHLIQTEMKRGNVHAFLYDGYWEDIGTIESYYKANMALTEQRHDIREGFYCYDEKNVIMTKAYRLPGAKITGTEIRQSLLCEGAVIEASEITHSIIGVRSVIGQGTVIRDSILMGNEFYERKAGNEVHSPQIGQRCVLQKVIVDENVTIGNDVLLINEQKLQHYDSPEGAPAVFVRDGIIVIPRGALIPDGFVF